MNDVIDTISPDRPERISLDFERLRAEGIRRLEEWAPYIWTDFNAHDPGITILEALCYGITDLAYRTQLPIEDLLASIETGGGKTNFFRAEEILPNYPVSEIDFRKLLIDLPGIKNAWLKKTNTYEPRICIRQEKKSRPLSSTVRDRITGFLENNTSDQVSDFEKALQEILQSDELVEADKQPVRDILTQFVRDPNNVESKELGLIRQIAGRLGEQKTADQFLLLAERLENFHWYFRCTYEYHELSFKSADGITVDDLVLQTNDITHFTDEIRAIISKLNGEFTMEDMLELWDILDYLSLNYPEDAYRLFHIANLILCRLSYYELKQLDEREDKPEKYEWIQYNGLYEVTLDLHDPTIAPDTKAAKRHLRTAMERLQEHRNLCEDYININLVETQFLCLCLDVEVESGLEEQEVMAEIMFQLQEFLAPTIRFFSLQQMLQRGLTVDQIFNGPLLEHGFIPDNEMERGKIPEKVFISDLYQIILSVPGVQEVNELAIKKAGDDNYVSDLSCLPMDGKKPVVDLCNSCLYTSRDGFRIRILEKDIKDLLELKVFESRNLVGDPNAPLSIPRGTAREDLAEFTSVQMEFPENYAIGLNGPPPEASPLRNAQIKQLQAYLTFFDRLMANYLQQLSKVKDIFSVEQDPEEPTYFFDALYHIPGIKELIFQPVTFGESQMKDLRDKLPEEAVKLLEGSDLIGQSFTTFGAWNQAMENALDHYWSDHSEYRQVITQVIKQDYSEDEWKAFMADDDNVYMQKLQEIIEPKHRRQSRKNQILDHLLARFGEQFTDFSLQQFGVSQEVSLFDNSQDYLRSKADFLRHIPALSSSRAKGYNYRKFKTTAEQKPKESLAPDVWNTTNVSGLKERIYSLLNMGPPTTESVFCDPLYRIDLEKNENADRPRFFLKLVELEQSKTEGENNIKGDLLISTKSYTRNQALARQKKLRENISRQDWYKMVVSDADTGSFRIQFSFEDGSDTTILASEELNKKQAENLQNTLHALVDMAACPKESFHFIEHILLRPMVNEDALLKHTYTCDVQMRPLDSYSFWLTIILPGWTRRFKDPGYRTFFEQVVRRETPAHIALCFRWLEEEDQITMKKLEDALEKWREAKAECDPEACDVAGEAKKLIEILNNLPCGCSCPTDIRRELLCGCEEETPIG